MVLGTAVRKWSAVIRISWAARHTSRVWRRSRAEPGGHFAGENPVTGLSDGTSRAVNNVKGSCAPRQAATSTKVRAAEAEQADRQRQVTPGSSRLCDGAGVSLLLRLSWWL